MKRLVAILIGMVFVLSGCGHSVTNGTVIDKRFVPAHSWETTEPTYMALPVTRYSTSCSTVNKVTSCRQTSYVALEYRLVGYHQETHHADDTYTLTLKDSNSGDTGQVDVSADRYKGVSLGDTFNAEQ